MKLRRFAVSTDFSEDSRRAFPVAASLARAFEAELSVVHQARVPISAPSWKKSRQPRFRTAMDRLYGSLQARLTRLVDTDPDVRGVPEREPRLLRDAEVEAFVNFLDGEGISLLVVATHGSTGAERYFLGSFAEKLLRIATCPVLVCPTPNVKKFTAGGFSPRRMLVASDLSPHSLPALLTASSWAQKFGSTLRLFSVVEKPVGMFGYTEEQFEGWWEYLMRIQEETHKKLEEAIREHCQGVEIEKKVGLGQAADEILREVADFQPDLLVVGTHGRAGLEDFLLGSVSRQIVASSMCPVLVVRPQHAHG